MVRRGQYCLAYYLVELLQGGTGHSFDGGGCSSEIQLLERMKNCRNQS